MIAVVVAPLLTLVGNAVYLSKLTAVPPIDLTPVGFTLGMILMSLALFRWHFFELVPLAHDTVIDAMPEGVLLADERGRLIDANRAAQQILGVSPERWSGDRPSEVLPARLVELIAGPPRRESCELGIAAGSEVHTYDAVVSPLASHGGTVRGRLLVLRDVTVRKRSRRDARGHRSRAAALESGARAAREHRSADPARQPPSVLRAPRGGDQARSTTLGVAGAGDARPRPLQARQRCARARRRRPGAEGGGRAAVLLRARVGHGGAPRRRGVRAHPADHRPRRRAGGRRACSVADPRLALPHRRGRSR